MPKRTQPIQQQGPDPSRRAWWIFALCVLFGVAGLAFFAQQGIRDYRVFHAYQPAQCTVTGKGVLTSTTSAGMGRMRRPMTTFRSQYMFEHDANGRHITTIGSDNMDGVMGDPDIFNVGQAYPCWRDPSDPAEAVLSRHFYPLFYSAALVPLIFLVVGGNFLLLALGPRAAIAIADGGQAETLAVRLAPELSREATLVFLVAIFIAFSAALLGALTWTVQDWSRLEEWGLFLLIAIGAEAWLIRFTMSAMKASSANGKEKEGQGRRTRRYSWSKRTSTSMSKRHSRTCWMRSSPPMPPRATRPFRR